MSTLTPEFDIIFAGGMFLLLGTNLPLKLTLLLSGGTTACVTASRLAAADPSLKILILEAGPTTFDDAAHTQPARYIYHLRPDSTTVKSNIARPSEHLGGRSIVVPCGQCLGGGSSVNCGCPLGLLSSTLIVTRNLSNSYNVHQSFCI